MVPFNGWEEGRGKVLESAHCPGVYVGQRMNLGTVIKCCPLFGGRIVEEYEFLYRVVRNSYPDAFEN